MVGGAATGSGDEVRAVAVSGDDALGERRLAIAVVAALNFDRVSIT
jgi:hypothetical protein